MSACFESIRTFFVILLGLSLMAVFLRRRSAAVRNQVCRLLLVGAWIAPIIGTFVAVRPGLPVATISPATIQALPAWTPASMMPREAREVRRLPDADVHASYERESRALSTFSTVQILGMLLLLPGCRGWFRLRRLERGATVLERHTALTVLRASDPNLRVPVTYGLPARILLPAESAGWPEGRVRAAILHEAAHVRRKDWLWGRFMWVFSLMNWWNPAVYFLARTMRATSEAAADDEVLADGLCPSDYARELLAVAAHTSGLGSAAVAMVGRGGVRERVRAILEPGRDRRRTTFVLGAATGFLVSGVTLALGSATTRFDHYTLPSPPGMVAARGDVAVLSDGTTVRLDAISAYGFGAIQVWLPGGQPGPSRYRSPNIAGGSRYPGRFLHIRLEVPRSADDAHVAVRMTEAPWTGSQAQPWSGTPTASGRVTGLLWAFGEPGLQGLSSDVLVGVASGARRSLRLPVPEASRMMSLPSGGTGWVGLRLPAWLRDKDCALTAVSSVGQRYAAGGNINQDGWVDIGYKSSATTEIAAVEVAYRPYRWAMFHDVRLFPNGDVPNLYRREVR